MTKRVLRMKYHVTHYHKFQGWRVNCDKYVFLAKFCLLAKTINKHFSTVRMYIWIAPPNFSHNVWYYLNSIHQRICCLCSHFMLYCACQRGSNLLLWALGMRTHANGSVSIWALLCVQATCPPPRQQNKVFPICPTSFDFNNHPSFARESSTSVHVDLASFKAVCFHTGASERYSPTALLEKWQCHWAVSI